MAESKENYCQYLGSDRVKNDSNQMNIIKILLK